MGSSVRVQGGGSGFFHTLNGFWGKLKGGNVFLHMGIRLRPLGKFKDGKL